MTAAEIIISRLPQTPLVTPLDVACAMGRTSSAFILEAVKAGELPAVKSGQYLISRDSAVEYVKSLEKKAVEA